MNHMNDIKKYIADLDINHRHFELYYLCKDIFGFRYAFYGRRTGKGDIEIMQEQIGLLKYLKFKFKFKFLKEMPQNNTPQNSLKITQI